MSVKDELERELLQTGDPGVARALWDLYMDAGEDPTPSLEKAWRKRRDVDTTHLLAQFYTQSGRDPEVEFERLKQEVAREVHLRQIEEITGEHGNLEEKPWMVNELTYQARYVHQSHVNPRTRDAIVPPDVVTPDGVELWVAEDSIHRKQPAERVPVLDYPPEYLQRELEGEFGRDAEFVTTYTYQGEDNEHLADAKTGDVYRRVRTETFGERECPFATWDSEEREDATENVVKEPDTWFGESPGRRCMMCDEAIGEEHGYLNGEYEVGNVYVKLVPRQLRSTVNEPDVEEEVLRTYRHDFDVGEDDLVDAFYEHGQWFVRHTVYGERGEDDVERTYSVVDVEIAGGQQFDFEEL